MSCIILLLPAIVGSWVAIAAAADEAVEELGFRSVNTKGTVDIDQKVKRPVELILSANDVVADAMTRESEFTVEKDGVTATFRREPDGRCIVRVVGLNKTDAELQAIGEELVNRVTQRYAYNKVMSEMKNQGFTVTSEEVTEDNSIKIHVSKYV